MRNLQVEMGQQMQYLQEQVILRETYWTIPE